MKKIFIVLIAIVIILVSIITIDYLIARSNKIPFLAIKETKDNVKIYKGLFYEVNVCNGNVAFNASVICPKDLDFAIVDETEICAEALELFYEDDHYKYYFPCMKSSTTFIKKDGKKITIKEALEKEVITIDSLLKTGLSFIREEKYEISIKKSSSCKTIKYQIGKEDTNSYLYTYCLDSVTFKRGIKETSLVKQLAEGSNSLEEMAISSNLVKEDKDNYKIYKSKDYVILICKDKNYIGTIELLDKNVCK